MQRFYWVVIVSLFIAQPIMADERSATLQQIEMAKKEVAELEKALGKLRVQQSTSLKQLRATETEIANLEKKVAELKKEQAETEAKLIWLGEEKEKAEQKRIEQERIFASQAKATYESGRQEYLKLLLNQQQPDKLSRTLVYYDYLSQARLVQLTEFQETVKQLKDIEAEMAHYQQQLQAQNASLQEQHVQLDEVRKKRRQVVASLNRQIKEKNDRVVQRERDQIELSKVLRTIDATLAQQAREREAQQQKAQQQTNAATGSKQGQSVVANLNTGFSGNFAQAKGKLSWPISGKIIANYGTARGDDNRAKWDGVLISATQGAPVKAVHEGRVVYSDWLRGTGWLIIIDHGQGYYSLYGHNQTLLKKVGDVVKTGDSVATAGNSGGTENTALYFSIRQQGQAVNPVLWCR